VQQPEAEIPRLIAACGLADEPATRTPHLSQRAVITMSHAEVREPINPARAGAAQAFPVATRKLAEALQRHGLA
jgi:hypothetical protein